MLIYAVAIWVFAATIVARLPRRRQFVPGVVLLAAAPFVIAWVGWVYGWVAGLLALAGFVSMFRNPLRYFYKKFRGQDTQDQKTEVPK